MVFMFYEQSKESQSKLWTFKLFDKPIVALVSSGGLEQIVDDKKAKFKERLKHV